MIEEFKVAKCRLVMTLRDSADQKIRDVGVQTRSRRKWPATTAVDQAESMLELRDTFRNTCRGREGIGVPHFQSSTKADKTKKRSMVQVEVRREVEDGRKTKAAELSKPGDW